MIGKDETLRWPTKLDHRAIVRRLVDFRNAAATSGLAELSARFRDVETMSAARIAVNVVATLSRLLDANEHRVLAGQLEMVALNLRNLRDDRDRIAKLGHGAH